VSELRLTHPGLAFWVDIAVFERDGRFMAAADLAEDSRDIGVGDTPREAVRAALRALAVVPTDLLDGPRPPRWTIRPLTR
jgi:hypothetical protein